MKTFDYIVNVLVAIAAIVGTYSFATSSPTAARKAKAMLGVRIEAPAGVKWGDNSGTLVLALRAGCHFCEESMPFYRRLSDLSRNHQTATALLAIFPDKQATVEEIVKKNRLDIQFSPDVSLQSLNVTGTPTLLLVDSRGKVNKAWVGALSQAREDEVLKAIQSR
jgi:hypothetical protein